jgi:hypothetical protein
MIPQEWTPQADRALTLERRARMAARAVQDTPIICMSASARSVMQQIPAQVPPAAPKLVSYGKRYKAVIVRVPLALPTAQLGGAPYVCIDVIVRCACRYFGADPIQMKSSQARHVVHQRNVTMHLIRTLTGAFHKDIAEHFDLRRNTVMFNLGRMSAFIKADWKIAFDVAHIEAMMAADGYFLRTDA